MNLALTLGVTAAALLAGCGGGGEDVSPAEAARMLLDQSGECFAISAGRTSPAKFNAAAEQIASVGVDAVCTAWPAGLVIDCRAAYASMTLPYSHPGQCKVVLAG